MTSNPADPARSSLARPRWGWIVLALALGWVALLRVPLVLNAKAHLDSDLAVDGLTLIDALNGHWRWHYPATPFIGTPPVLLSYLQAKVWGPGPMTLVSGGVVAYGLLVVATYLVNRRAFGPGVAAWGLAPLAFASTGTIWLSGRVTGGHLLAAAWHAGAFALLWAALVRGGWRRSAALGAWCGFGLYIDTMFVITWAGLGVAVCVFAGHRAIYPLPPGEERWSNRLVRSVVCLLAFAVASGVGVAPRIIGARVDPHDAYVGQFQPVTRAEPVLRNARLLLLDCLPRLIAGHRLPGLQAEPDPAKLAGGAGPPKGEAKSWLAIVVALVSIGLFLASMGTLVLGGPAREPATLAIRLGLLVSSLAVIAGFLVHPSITDSDNYRYLVFLLVPWSSGFGLTMARVASKGRARGWLAGALALGFALVMTADSARWYAGLGFVDSAYRPVRKPVEEPAIDWLDDHLRVSTILGDYWDVYRISFLTLGRVRAVPFPQYPDRFPEIGRGLPLVRNVVVIVRPGSFGPLYRRRALQGGGRELMRARGLSIVQWPEGMTP